MKAQQQGKELVGWATTPLHEKAIATDLRIGSEPLPLNRTFIDPPKRNIPAVFWYHINRNSHAHRYLAKLATIKQAFLRGRTDAALVLISSEPQTGQSEGHWRAQEEFAGVVFPVIQDYLP